MVGTVNISRDLWDDTAFRDSEMSQREAWIWMIASASWKARTKRFGVHEIELQRGQLAASTRFMAKAWKWSEPRVRRYLDMLENRRMIERVTDAGVAVVTICKYEDYQNKPRVGDAVSTQQPTQDRRTTDANQNKGEIKDIDDDDDARARDPALPPSDPTFRERILTAIGVDPVTGLTGHGGGMLGTRHDVELADRWKSELGLTEETIIAVVAETMAKKPDGQPPNSFKYFHRAMQREAARRDAPPLKPEETNVQIFPPKSGARQSRSSAADDAFAERISFAARNRSPSRDDFGFG